jgi:hypothetical protein
LLDPLTDQKFAFEEIPRSYFPATADLVWKQKYEKLSESTDAKMALLLPEIHNAIQAQAQAQAQARVLARQVESRQAQALALAQADLPAQSMRSIALHGEFYYNESGIKQYKGGAFDGLNSANF